MTPEQFAADMLKELDRARAKFPSANLAGLALMEEVGELAQAVLHRRAGKCTSQQVYEEAIQVAAMAIRVALEHDESLAVPYSEPAHSYATQAPAKCPS